MFRMKEDGLYVKVVREDGEAAVSKLEEQYAEQAVENLPEGVYVISKHDHVFRIFRVDDLDEKETDEADDDLN